ncbi:transcriptional regulator with XRE-family HTH domain [Geomicrobium halophilum]|uniref:Transcriptional regulator with XRE-family HTH domain n=1 Tax=Geomicrobium halophilum TaxID=549000 RepID=A0A841PZ11_9BACL|nr:helix-turn-helix transcriptional regulator [Geomicrobium halophilum]MBB6449752.1 transcriptional regulator with XRE-family HTH domain [Geomicrobium halophilum]
MKAEEFGKYLRELRKKNNMTLRQLSLYSNVSHPYLSQLENGKKAIPSANVLKKISKGLKVSHELLMQKAGYIDTDTETEKRFNELINDPQTDLMFKDWDKMNEEQREEALQMLKFILYKGENDS